MASIIKTSINLNNIPKDRIFEGKKGKYLPITITLNDHACITKMDYLFVHHIGREELDSWVVEYQEFNKKRPSVLYLYVWGKLKKKNE